MRSLLFLFCLFFAVIAVCSHVSYGGTHFYYDIDRFTQVGGTLGTPNTLNDEFDDGLEPPSGPGGPGTYGVHSSFSPTAENGGLLNLSSNDAWNVNGSGSRMIGATNETATPFIKPATGGRVEGKFKLTNGMNVNTGFGIQILEIPLPDNASSAESVVLGMEKMPSGNIIAIFDSKLNGLESNISSSNITNSVLGSAGITEVTLRLDVSTANVVTASIDFGSDGTFELLMQGSHTLNFFPGNDYTGNFGAWSFSDITGDFIPQTNGSFSFHISNDYPENLPVEWKFWAEIAGTKIPVINLGSGGAIKLPPSFNATFPIFFLGLLPPGITLGSRFVDPVTGQEFCVDTMITP
ncbi:hypothetical protein SCALIN_C11_0016 [Candidatus Scalindua japonica]|uniref:Uncharacterized protein n=1 Tax=Candidatus Scalindua japonica TaxID=1284222 RepID=A0A286TX08_9BACT|nr:hypothetical protein [Candidatus Scalindua japonica]GAX60405.1 hypothetical protein SCALIN_C11_0016 [Candidatus Scalindua japonica]